MRKQGLLAMLALLLCLLPFYAPGETGTAAPADTAPAAATPSPPTIFDDLPDDFEQVYDEEREAWIIRIPADSLDVPGDGLSVWEDPIPSILDLPRKEIPAEDAWVLIHFAATTAAFAKSLYPMRLSDLLSPLFESLNREQFDWEAELSVDSSAFSLPLSEGLGREKVFISRFHLGGIVTLEIEGRTNVLGLATSAVLPQWTDSQGEITFTHQNQEHTTTWEDYIDAQADCIVSGIRLIIRTPFQELLTEDAVIVVQ